MQRIDYRGRTPGLLAQLAGFIVGLVVIAVALFLGTLLLAAIVGVAMIIALVVGVRAWWLRRQLRSGPGASGIIEAEYEVIETREPND